MLNHITIMGRLTRDPELRQTSNGNAVASFTLAVDRDYADKDKNRETDFIDCVAWRGTGEFVAKNFAKGQMAVVDGRLQLRDYMDKEGNKRRATEVIVGNVYFGGPKTGDNAQSGQAAPNGNFAQPNGNSYGAPQGGNFTQSQSGYADGGYGIPQGGNFGAPQGGDFAPIDMDDDQLPF